MIKAKKVKALSCFSIDELTEMIQTAKHDQGKLGQSFCRAFSVDEPLNILNVNTNRLSHLD